MGNVMLGMMDESTRPFAVEILLPWAKQVALLEPNGSPTQISRGRQAELRGKGYCVIFPSQCLQRIFEYTLQSSIEGVPLIVSKFWESLALAVEPARVGAVPQNISSASAWVTSQATRQRNDRYAQTSRSLALYIKGLVIMTSAEAAKMQLERDAIKKGRHGHE